MTDRKTVLLIGEGPTEFYYFSSLRNLMPGLKMEPVYPKHTSIKEIGAKIERGVSAGYSLICCVVDMDTKDNDTERREYVRLKQKYAKPVIKPRQGIDCEVRFFETHRCTELFFLYYFAYTSKYYADQPTLIKELNAHCDYEKTEKFFRSCSRYGGLHGYFTEKGGDLEQAVGRADRSWSEKERTGRDYTYSQLGELLRVLRACYDSDAAAR